MLTNKKQHIFQIFFSFNKSFCGEKINGRGFNRILPWCFWGQ